MSNTELKENFVNLANAIIEQAVKDYRSSLNYLKTHEGTEPPNPSCRRRSNSRLGSRIREMQRMKDECELFFTSDWFMLLSNLDGEELMKRIQRMER